MCEGLGWGVGASFKGRGAAVGYQWAQHAVLTTRTGARPAAAIPNVELPRDARFVACWGSANGRADLNKQRLCQPCAGIAADMKHDVGKRLQVQEQIQEWVLQVGGRGAGRSALLQSGQLQRLKTKERMYSVSWAAISAAILSAL